MAGSSKSVKKAEQTKKEKYGADFHKRIGALGGHHRTRGYFGKLKDEGQLEELQRLGRQGAAKSNQVQGPQRTGKGQAGLRRPTATPPATAPRQRRSRGVSDK